MVQINLLGLRQSRTIALTGSVGQDSEIWAGSGLKFSGAVEVTGTAALTAGGGVIVQGAWKAPLLYECGRCLDELQVAVEKPLALVFVPAGEWEGSDPDVRPIGDHDTLLDLEDAIREEILLEAPRYYTAAEESGRCVRCGDPTDRFKSGPAEADGEVDPRWSALRALRTD